MKNLVNLSVALFVKGLQAQNPQIRFNAVRISQMENNTKNAVSTLIAALQDPQLRYNAVVALGNIGTAAEIAIPALINALEDEDIKTRISVIESLCKIASPNLTIPALINALQDKSEQVRARAAFALGCFREKSQLAVESLILTLQDNDEWVRTNTAEALGRIPQQTNHAIEALVAALQDNYPGVRIKAALALGYIGNERQTISALIDSFPDPDARVRAAIADSLGNFTEKGQVAVPILIAALEDSDISVRINAAKALTKIGLEIEASMAVLIEALKSEDASVRITVALNLGIIAVNFYEKANKLSISELEPAILNLETVFDILQSQNLEVTKFALVSVSNALDILKKERKSRSK